MTLTRNVKIEPKHAGIIFKNKVLKDNAFNTSKLSESLGLPEESLRIFLNGKLSVTPALASKLEEYSGISSGFWSNTQNNYDLFKDSNN